MCQYKIDHRKLPSFLPIRKERRKKGRKERKREGWGREGSKGEREGEGGGRESHK